MARPEYALHFSLGPPPLLTRREAKLHRGTYAIQVHGKVPEDILQEHDQDHFGGLAAVNELAAAMAAPDAAAPEAAAAAAAE